MNPPTPEQFREAGFTAAAINFPLSVAAQKWLATFNGVPFEKIPEAWKYAPNPWMQNYLETEAAKPPTAELTPR